MRYGFLLLLLLGLPGCGSERHFAGDTLWPFGNPNAPDNSSETAERALGGTPGLTPIAVQAGDVWPGPVQPVPTIADIEKNMNQPLGQAYIPSLPSPYPPGQPPPAADRDDDPSLPIGISGAGTSPAGALPAGALPPPELPPGNPHARE